MVEHIMRSRLNGVLTIYKLSGTPVRYTDGDGERT